MYLHALNLLFVHYYHLIYERERSSEPMIPGTILAIRKVLCYLHVILLSVILYKNHKNKGY
jgi:hypothetical protein